MKASIAALALATVPVAAHAAVETYPLDPFHTFTYFTVEHFGLSNQFGRFDRTAGTITLDRAARTGSVDVVVDTASVDTGDNDKAGRPRSRDEVLRSADFFNSAEFPKMTYKSARVVFNGDTPTAVEGDLTLLGTTRPVTLTIERFRCNAAQGPRKERCGGNATAKIKRSDFGMKYGLSSLGDEISIMIAFEGDKASGG